MKTSMATHTIVVGALLVGLALIPFVADELPLAGLSMNGKSKMPEMVQPVATVTPTASPASAPNEAFKEQAEPSAQLVDVPLMLQNPELPRGCEVTSLAMLLGAAGVLVDKMELADAIAKVPFEDDGYRGDMNEGFVGDIYSFDNPGLGVYAKPVFELGEMYLPDRLLNLTGSGINALYRQLDQGSAVWVIANTEFRELPDKDFVTWQTKNGPMQVTYREHSVVMTGYDDRYVYIRDPLDDDANKRVSRSDFEAAWVQMGRQAISYTAEGQTK